MFWEGGFLLNHKNEQGCILSTATFPPFEPQRSASSGCPPPEICLDL